MFSYRDVADPIPARSEVWIRVQYISVEGADLAKRSGIIVMLAQELKKN